jgi:sulfotransferase family protein
MQQGPDGAEAHIAEMQRVLQYTRPWTEAEASLRYALHHRLDALGRHAQAWASLERGLAIKRRITPYDRQAQHALFDALKRLELPARQRGSAATRGTGLIFIVGMYRSGTTLIERVLAGHPDVTDGGETFQFSACMRQATDHDCMDVVDAGIVARAPSADFDVVARRMQAYADWRSNGHRWLTEKLPSNFLNIGFILHALPEARIIHMQRDPVEVGFSNLRTIFTGAAPYASDQQDFADYYLQYQQLMAHWHAQAPGRILDVDYASFVENPTLEAQRLMDYCGLDFLPEALDLTRPSGHVATASAAHVRAGVLKNRSRLWKPYEQYLQPMIRTMQSNRPD